MSLPLGSTAELQTALANGTTSSVELTERALARATALSSLNAFITLDSAGALRQAAAADAARKSGKQGTLLGVPVAVKDVVITRGVRTTCGSKILGSFVPPYDATAVQKLRDSGAVIIGKTNMDEFAMGSSNENSAFGAVKNPWNQSYVPGGSSGGSAAAVAAGIVPMALGSDTGGSIRQPASFCGIVGMKPTYGRVSRYGLVAFASSLDQIGPFGQTVHDCAVACNILCGHDSNDSTSVDKPVPDFTASLGRDIKGLRIGVPRQYFIGGIQPVVEKAVRAAIEKLASLGATVVDIDLPHTEAAVAVYYVLAPAEASSNLARFDGVRYGIRAEGAEDLNDMYCRTRSSGFGWEVKRRILVGTYVLSAGYFDAYYLRAQKVRSLIAKDFRDAFASHCDVIVCPTAPTPPFKLAEKVEDPLAMYLNDVYTIPVNLAGLPGMSLPCGFSADGLPIGLQLIGKPFDEESLFRVAAAYESNTEWHKQRAKV